MLQCVATDTRMMAEAVLHITPRAMADVAATANPPRVLITGASRGIGAAVARCFARRHPGAHIALLARSASKPSHPALEGTLLDVARDCEALGAMALPIEMDLRGDARHAVRSAVHSFGGLDVLVNNASALNVSARPSEKQVSLVTDVNVKGTLAVSLACAEALRLSEGSMVTMSPPVDLDRPEWIAGHPHYTVSKYAMTMMTLGFAATGIRANCLWPRYMVSTAATKTLEMAAGADGAYSRGRPPEDVADAIYALATSDLSGHALYDDEAYPDMPPPPKGAPLDAFVQGS